MYLALIFHCPSLCSNRICSRQNCEVGQADLLSPLSPLFVMRPLHPNCPGQLAYFPTHISQLVSSVSSFEIYTRGGFIQWRMQQTPHLPAPPSISPFPFPIKTLDMLRHLPHSVLGYISGSTTLFSVQSSLI